MDELNSTLASLQLGDFSSAKIKIDQLFFEWLCIEGQIVIDSVLLKEEPLSDDESINSSKCNIDLLHSLQGISQSQTPLPPRSPTNTKKSPKKRTQSEMQNNTNPNDISVLVPENSVNESSLSSNLNAFKLLEEDENDLHDNDNDSEAQISARRRSNFDSIPLFYVPGDSAGGIYHGNRIELDSLSKRLGEIESHFAAYPDGDDIYSPINVYISIYMNIHKRIYICYEDSRNSLIWQLILIKMIIGYIDIFAQICINI
jgi:hypothetical protein